jgi:5'-nucleotidase
VNRKDFLQKSILGTTLIGLGQIPIEVLASAGMTRITILHTNDQHSRVEPFPMDGGKHQGKGGMERRATIIDEIRKQERNVILLDSGDIFQGTPYFNKFFGAVEIELMNKMRYDASTFGNHDFDGGLENLAIRMNEAKFPFINSNYDITNSPLNKTKQYKVFHFDKIKVGVFGLGIEPNGLIPKSLYGDIVYNDPISVANNTAAILRHDEKCNLVICLSHLGYSYDGKKIADVVLAKQTKNIDLILGGHTHTFLDEPKVYKNIDGEIVLINQVGWAGLVLGRVDFIFDHKKRKEIAKKTPIKIG